MTSPSHPAVRRAAFAVSIAAAGAIALAGHPALAAIGDAIQKFACSSSNACLTATNRGSGPAIVATSNNYNGIQATSNTSAASAVYGFNSQSGYAIAGRVKGSGTALFADAGGSGGIGVLVFGGSFSSQTLFEGQNNGVAKFTVDNSGNLAVSGLLFSAGGCHAGCSLTHRAVSYASTASEPTLEDAGESAVRGGVAHVALDPAFANAIDRHSRYLVFVTPEGQTRGLYVAQRTDGGFVVRDADANANVPFAYRVVARPYGIRAPRLPMVDGLVQASHLVTGVR
ncbi:MAG: hypothetical protein ABI346_02500 [Candidatus Baltobacteraceae bacterium]